MGVDFVIFDELCKLSTRFQPAGRTLMLGRHKWQPQGRLQRKYQRAWKQAGKEGDFLATVQEDGYCETLMSSLGFGQMEALDFSDYEGATILQDLNCPVGPELEGQFDLIFDGGTLEHVFNVPMALQSVFRMLKPGGRFISVNGMNGWMGHGLYQFNPELVWSFWKRTCGCKVHVCKAVEKDATKEGYELAFPDPAIVGRRLRFRGINFPAGRVYLYYEVERLPDSVMGERMLQSDYEVKWTPHNNAGEIRDIKAKEAQDGRD
ncbi:Methyltransferase domain-containing protein [Gemmobacter aquatilis]|uniref:Methyltransferase domain-containing protein n=1 Tax=Gemmobacter aquatilis TaxID=933059 RepID=A0A1H8GX10_9RHOB|nr:methyltransferase domain-containing protein [Gemmobacter aquatilis]SEN48007.1 Methyltransferase domain-containing protein [Gemmobacter aquatilis]